MKLWVLCLKFGRNLKKEPVFGMKLEKTEFRAVLEKLLPL